jgi:hypothetical protein
MIGAGLLGLALLAGLAVRFVYADYAPESFRIVASDLAPVVIWDEVNALFPERPESPARFWTRGRDQAGPATLSLSSYPLSNLGIRLLIGLTLIVPGVIALIVMGQQERVTIRVEEQEGASLVSARARGYVACVQAEEFLRQVSR